MVKIYHHSPIRLNSVVLKVYQGHLYLTVHLVDGMWLRLITEANNRPIVHLPRDTST
jgi:hypothetical protein